LTSGVFSFQFAIGYRRRFSVCHRLPPTVLSLPSATADGSLPSATADGFQFAIGYRRRFFAIGYRRRFFAIGYRRRFFAIGYRRRFSVCHRLPPTVLSLPSATADGSH